MRLLLLAIPVFAATARPADACSPPQCWPGTFVPHDGATVPANAPGFFFRPSRSDVPGDASLVRLTAASDPTTSLAFTAVPQPGGDFVIVPDAPLVAGETYTLDDGTVCGNGTLRSTFTAGPAAPLPSSLGSLQIVALGVAELDVATTSGSCSVEVTATVAQIALAASASAEPWKDLFLYETLVDGVPRTSQVALNVSTTPGESWVGRGVDLLYHVCVPDPDAGSGIPLGPHEIRFRATLPGATGTASLATPVESIELQCPPGIDPGPETPSDDSDGGCSTARPASLGFMLLVLGLLLRSRSWR